MKKLKISYFIKRQGMLNETNVMLIFQIFLDEHILEKFQQNFITISYFINICIGITTNGHIGTIIQQSIAMVKTMCILILGY